MGPHLSRINSIADSLSIMVSIFENNLIHPSSSLYRSWKSLPAVRINSLNWTTVFLVQNWLAFARNVPHSLGLDWCCLTLDHSWQASGGTWLKEPHGLSSPFSNLFKYCLVHFTVFIAPMVLRWRWKQRLRSHLSLIGGPGYHCLPWSLRLSRSICVWPLGRPSSFRESF